MHETTCALTSLPLNRTVRRLAAGFQQAIVFNALDAVARVEVRGRKNLHALQGPCIFAANHGSHLDVPSVLHALPAARRTQIAVPAAADYWFHNPLTGLLVSLAFNLFPLDRRGNAYAGLKRAGELLADGWSLLIFPEGTRSQDGRIGRFKAGAALLAVRHGVPIVPVKIAGAYQALPKGNCIPRSGHIVVTFGKPICFAADTGYQEAIKQVAEAVTRL